MATIVLLPGMDGTGQLLGEFVRALRPDVEPIVVTYPPDVPLNYEQLETFVRDRLPSDRPFVLLGESFSGPIAVSIAASAPVALRGVVLCCSFVKNPRPWLSVLRSLISVVPIQAVPVRLMSSVLLGRFSTPESRLALSQALSGVSVAALRARLLGVLGVNVSPHLSRVKVPVLYLRASEDRAVPRAASRLVSRLLPSAMVTEVEAPHFLLQVAPVVAAQHIRSFMHESVGL